MTKDFRSWLTLLFLFLLLTPVFTQQPELVLNEKEYFERPGLNVMVFHDVYPEGHQSGVTIIQNGVRVAANGDLRLSPAPGQWQPVPKVGKRSVDADAASVSVSCAYPNPDLNRKGFNPIIYPDLDLQYNVNVQAHEQGIRITVDLAEALPAEWVGKVGFNLELFPGELFGRSFLLDNQLGLFPTQLNGPMTPDPKNGLQVRPLGIGKELVIAPEDDSRRMRITARKGELQLLDGRAHHNNGWFIVRGVIHAGATKAAIDWVINPHVLDNWQYSPVIHLSQVGYQSQQKKVAVIELDARETERHTAHLVRILPSGEHKLLSSAEPDEWGVFIRYRYLTFNFSQIWEKGIYQVIYGDAKSQPFIIAEDIFERHVWQPVLEYFLPVQMCHMRVNDRYRVWHGLCHMDDALMAPTDTLHFDGYRQGSSTLTDYQSQQHVPGLNVGGWHDAGDYDLRVESQAGTIRTLALMREAFGVHYDQTTVDQATNLVELHRPDGKLDILQQIEHGALSVVGGYRSLGRLYRGIICPQLRQYVLLGDASVMTDNLIYDASLEPGTRTVDHSGIFDDRWVFTEENPQRELYVAACLAAATRVLQNYNKPLADECLDIAKQLWANYRSNDDPQLAAAKIEAAAALLLTTHKAVYKEALGDMLPEVQQNIDRIGWMLGRVQPLMDDKFNAAVQVGISKLSKKLQSEVAETPFGVPYRPKVWGAGWDLQRFAVQQYYLHTGWPEIISKDYLLNALNFVLGCHPGQNTSSFVSGVGSRSPLVAYGTNRADWSFIPGGSISGTGLIRPDFPELKEWPFFWQQTEYVIGGGASNFMFMVLAANQLLTSD